MLHNYFLFNFTITILLLLIFTNVFCSKFIDSKILRESNAEV